MELGYLDNGNLIRGIHELTWDEFVAMFGYTDHRKFLISGLKIAMNGLKMCNCQRVYIDGSFTTIKEKPGDWDGCFDPTGVNLQMLFNNYPFFFDLVHPRHQQKMIIHGEIFPSTARANSNGETFLDFFQKDKIDNSPKGIIQLLPQNFIL